MFSSIIRLGVAIFGSAILASCGGSSVSETQQSTPEGLFAGPVTITAPAVPAVLDASGNVITPAKPAIQSSQNMLVFVVNTGVFYAFYTENASSLLIPANVVGALQGTFSFSGGGMIASSIEDLSLLGDLQSGGAPGVNFPSFAGQYNTGQNILGTLTYPDSGVTVNFTPGGLAYNVAYQGVQNLSTLAGTYKGTVGTSVGTEDAEFTFGTPSVPANSGNQLGTATITGTGADGCTYTGIASPLAKGNGYSTSITSGPPPCNLPYTQFGGLVYLDTTNNYLYSYAPDVARTDGLIFTGTKL